MSGRKPLIDFITLYVKPSTSRDRRIILIDIPPCEISIRSNHDLATLSASAICARSMEYTYKCEVETEITWTDRSANLK